MYSFKSHKLGMGVTDKTVKIPKKKLKQNHNPLKLTIINDAIQAPDEKEVGSAVAIEGGQVDTDDEYIHDDDPYQSDM